MSRNDLPPLPQPPTLRESCSNVLSEVSLDSNGQSDVRPDVVDFATIKTPNDVVDSGPL